VLWPAVQVIGQSAQSLEHLFYRERLAPYRSNKHIIPICSSVNIRILTGCLGVATFIGLFYPPFNSSAKEYSASSGADIEFLGPRLRPGDSVVMIEGPWRGQTIVFRAQGTARKPITLRAGTPGKTILTGQSSLKIEGEYVVVSGIWVRAGEKASDGIFIAGNHCRLTGCAVTQSTYKFFVHFSGYENRMDHCFLAEKTSDSPTLQVEVESRPNHHLIDWNYFGHRPPLGRNGGETMRVGYSWQSMSNSATTVENNLFERCDGEIEIISSKSCNNIYRGNTFLDCAGMLTLRHGNGCLVENNFFIGHHKRGSGGIRVIGEDHTIVNNYIEGVSQGGVWITSGIEDSPLKGYFCARNILLAFNTIVDSRGPYLDLSAGLGSARRTLLPENIIIANNAFAVPQDGTLTKGQQGQGWKWLGNLAQANATNLPGIRSVDIKLQRASDGLLRPMLDSPVRGAAEGDFPGIKTDFDGQPRKKRFDVGCDQISTARKMNRPLTPRDVGPSWWPQTK